MRLVQGPGVHRRIPCITVSVRPPPFQENWPENLKHYSSHARLGLGPAQEGVSVPGVSAQLKAASSPTPEGFAAPGSRLTGSSVCRFRAVPSPYVWGARSEAGRSIQRNRAAHEVRFDQKQYRRYTKNALFPPLTHGRALGVSAAIPLFWHRFFKNQEVTL